MAELCIVFTYYGDLCSICASHIERFQRFNPEADVAPVSLASQPIPSGWPYICKPPPHAWEYGPRMSDEWYGCDLLLYRFYELHPGYKKYLFVDWDVYCNQGVREFLGTSYHEDVVGGTLVHPDKDEPLIPGGWEIQKDWCWFKYPFEGEGAMYCEEFTPTLRGIVPAGFVLFSNRALAGMLKEMMHPIYRRMFCECRMGTAANRAGFEPVSFAPGTAHENIWFEPRNPENRVGIFHACKDV